MLLDTNQVRYVSGLVVLFQTISARYVLLRVDVPSH